MSALFVGIFLLALVGSALSLDRAPAFTLVVMVLTAALIGQGGPFLRQLVSVRVLALIVAAGVVGGFISIFQYGSKFSILLLASTAWYVLNQRVFQDAAFMSSLIFAVYNDPSTLLFGKSVRLLSYLGFQNVPAPPAGFVGDLWRNFGWPGVLLGSAILGFVMQTVQVKAFRVASVASYSLYIIALVGFAWLLYGNVLGTVTTAVPTLAIVVAFLIASPRARPARRSTGRTLAQAPQR